MQTDKTRLITALLFAAELLLAAAYWLMMIRFPASGDEIYHEQQLVFLVRNGFYTSFANGIPVLSLIVPYVLHTLSACTEIVALRIGSLLYFVLFMLSLYRMSKDMLPVKPQLRLLFITVCAILFIGKGFFAYALYDILLAMLLLWSFGYAVKYIRSQQKNDLLFSALFLAASTIVRPHSLIYILSLGIVAVLYVLLKRRDIAIPLFRVLALSALFIFMIQIPALYEFHTIKTEYRHAEGTPTHTQHCYVTFISYFKGDVPSIFGNWDLTRHYVAEHPDVPKTPFDLWVQKPLFSIVKTIVYILMSYLRIAIELGILTIGFLFINPFKLLWSKDQLVYQLTYLLSAVFIGVLCAYIPGFTETRYFYTFILLFLYVMFDRLVSEPVKVLGMTVRFDRLLLIQVALLLVYNCFFILRLPSLVTPV